LDREGSTAILIRNRPLSADELPSGVTQTLLSSFTGATTDENYWIYRITGPQPAGSLNPGYTHHGQKQRPSETHAEINTRIQLHFRKTYDVRPNAHQASKVSAGRTS